MHNDFLVINHLYTSIPNPKALKIIQNKLTYNNNFIKYWKLMKLYILLTYIHLFTIKQNYFEYNKTMYL